jgi:hypothetical protein
VDRKFAELVDQLAPKLEELLAARALRHGVLPREMPSSGVYLFSERGEHLYVGRSNDLRGRYGRHGREGATWRQAAFAFQLARREIGNLKASYVPGNLSRAVFMLNQDFRNAFDSARSEFAKWNIVTSRRATRIGKPSSRFTAPSCYARHSMTWRRTGRSSKFIE